MWVKHGKTTISHPQFHHFYRWYKLTILSHGCFMALFYPQHRSDQAAKSVSFTISCISFSGTIGSGNGLSDACNTTLLGKAHESHAVQPLNTPKKPWSLGDETTS